MLTCRMSRGGAMRKRKNGEPRTVCQHYRVTITADAEGREITSCVDCPHTETKKVDKPSKWQLR